MYVGDIRVAICVTGLVRAQNKMGNPKRYGELHQERLGGDNIDWYYTTWEDQQEAFERCYPGDRNVYYYEQPQNHYHPYMDVPEEVYSKVTHLYKDRVIHYSRQPENIQLWTGNHAKQILNYAYLRRDMNEAGREYDVYMRIRFDSIVNKRHGFEKWIKDCFETGTTHGFAVTKAGKFNEYYSHVPQVPKHRYYMLDQCVIHRHDQFDPQNAIDLFNKQHLMGAEWGWYQVLSHPEGNHKCHHGYINHDRHVLTQFMMEHG